MKVFYHDDNDGECAAAIIYQTESKHEKNIKCIALQYGDEFPHDSIEKQERIYILDFSIEPSDMKQLLETTQSVVWIDHHKTAIDKYSNFTFWKQGGIFGAGEIRGTRKVGISGCELSWQYYDFVDAGSAPIPEAIKLIGDRDIWAFKYGERTRDFYYGLKGLDLNPDNAIWNDIFKNPDDFVERGKVIRPAFENEANDIVRENGFWVDDFHGYKCFAANYFRGSEPFEAVEPNADVYLAFSYEGKNKCWTVSLYTTKPDVDVSEIAKQYEWHGKRGGGHRGAAGFQCDYPPFLKAGDK